MLWLIHKTWQRLEIFWWEEDENGADCGSQNSQALNTGLFVFYHTRISIRLNLKPANLEWKINAQTHLTTYGSCCCRRLLGQTAWSDFKVSWTLLGLTHYTGLKAMTAWLNLTPKRISLGFSLFFLEVPGVGCSVRCLKGWWYWVGKSYSSTFGTAVKISPKCGGQLRSEVL